MSFINIFKLIVQASILSSILACIILICRPMIKKIFSANILYLIWIILIIKLIVPYGPESELSIYNLFYKVESSISEEEKVVIMNSKNLSNTKEMEIPKRNLLEFKDNNVNSSIEDSKSENKLLNINTILYFLWIIGIVLKGLVSVKSYYKLIDIRKNMQCQYNRKSLKILDDSLNSLSIKRNIELLIVKKLNSPAICSIIKPKILIPEKIYDNVTDEELKYIILHELCHYKRKDVLLTWIIHLLKIVYWFNPIIVFSLNTIIEDCEIACDNMVVSRLDKKEQLSYGYTIISILSYIGGEPISIGITAMISKKKKIKERIEMIGENKKVSVCKILSGATIVIILGVITLSSRVNIEEVKADSNVQNNNSVVLNSSENSTNIIIYNSHCTEEYKDGYTVIDASNRLNDNLQALNMNSTFLEVKEPNAYISSYENSEEAIKEAFNSYEDSALIDVHVSESYDGISIDLAGNSPNYEENSKLAYKLKEQLETIGVKVEIYEYKEGNNYFNLHLSKEAIMINIGESNMDYDEVNILIDKVSEAIHSIL